MTAGLPAGASEMPLGQQQPKSPLGVERSRYAQPCNPPLTPPMRTLAVLPLYAGTRHISPAGKQTQAGQLVS